ncbi:WD40-repeat-containing domain protein [Microdochium trichocladiopsis]|uniref:WD40-repeat-containing domain protein n=1 Tax=Microdochium trichocladiopsis TaxID=1682393 RepID=A0A9P9BS88_9PEZI|nr:WD40-repeat-containing domain protein [Microdochium trichocladiopsis]KAH7034500.1 WD40-repeat-containing domain protein [Microdochium trichocladiopsis]
MFSHDSKTVASASGDKTVRIWDAESGECMCVLKGHSDVVNSVVFSHNSKVAASASDDKTVRIWDTESGNYVQVIQMGSFPSVLGFTANDGSIITNTGVIAITRKSCTDAITPSSSAASRLGLRDFSWVIVGDEDWLWLPAECRGGESAVTGTAVVIGCQSGRMVILRISVAGSLE